jgi:hypothetical protein
MERFCKSPDGAARPHRFSVSYGDERVTEVGRSLDQALEALLRRAAE